MGNLKLKIQNETERYQVRIKIRCIYAVHLKLSAVCQLYLTKICLWRSYNNNKNVCITHNSSYIEQKLTEMKRKFDQNTIIVDNWMCLFQNQIAHTDKNKLWIIILLDLVHKIFHLTTKKPLKNFLI